MKAPTILLVEDNAITRKMYRIALQLEHYNVLEAEDGKTALQLVKNHKIDLVLQDSILPDIKGLELCRQLKEIVPNINIIALSGFLSNLEEAQSSEFITFLLKPIEPSQLVKVVQMFLPSIQLKQSKAKDSKKLLIVDDNLTSLKLLKIQLNSVGYKVDMAENGKEALEHINNNYPDAIISDVLMPQMDGFELCLEIRQNYKYSKIPFILLSSQYLEEADRKLGKQVAANYYLTRTAENAELIEILKKCFKEKPKTLKPESINIFKEEHTHRLVRQLEHQININLGLAQQCALQSAQLSLLGGIADALTSSQSIAKTLQHVLATCLDASGISKGMLYLIEDSKITLHQHLGYATKEIKVLNEYFEKTKLMQSIITKRKTLQIELQATATPTEKKVLEKAGVASALFVPLISGSKCYGVLFLGSATTNVTGKDLIHFVQTLGTQLGQSVALSSTFEQLSESENRSRTLMSNASCAIYIVDKIGTIVEVNKQGEKLLQRQSQEIIGHHFLNFIAESERARAKSLFNQLEKEGSLRINELHALKKDGELILTEFSAVKVAIKKETLFMIIVSDITERTQLRMNAMMQDRLVISGTLLASVSHEINNPIAWILSNLNYLKKQLSSLKNTGNKPQDWQKMVTNLEEVVLETLQGAERVKEIVLMFKTFERNDEVEKASVAIHDLLNSAVKIAEIKYKYQVTLEKNFSSDLPSIRANSGQLHQVFLNLIINAAQAMPEDDIKQNKINITTTYDAQMIRIDVQDNGIGIDPIILPRIFDPFFSTKPDHIGTGLGLSICHEIIRKLHGKISVTSTLGKGSTFSVYLPINPDEASNEKHIIIS